MKRDNLKKGLIGELAAAEFLEKKGYKIVEMNYRTRFGEIDIVATQGYEPRVIFVEVKTKTGEEYGEPWEMVDGRKLGQIKRIATMYLKKKRLGEPLCRIDVVGVWLSAKQNSKHSAKQNGEVEKIEHWESVGG